MKFSLIICSYNPNLEWLEKAVESAKGLFDEYILVDDGSDIPVKIDGYKTFRKENGGLWTARNVGVKEATGDIICLLDDDDELIPSVVEEMKEFVRNNDADIYSHNIEMFGNQTGIYSPGFEKDKLLESNQFTGVSWYKKSVWEDVGGYTYNLAEDWDFWVKANALNKKFIVFDKIFYRNRRRDDSVSASWVGDKFFKIKNDIYENFINFTRPI